VRGYDNQNQTNKSIHYLSHISPNNLRTCLRNHHKCTTRTRAFESVAQERPKGSVYLQQIETQSREQKSDGKKKSAQQRKPGKGTARPNCPEVHSHAAKIRWFSPGRQRSCCKWWPKIENLIDGPSWADLVTQVRVTENRWERNFAVGLCLTRTGLRHRR
jgi:hypothetical protein